MSNIFAVMVKHGLTEFSNLSYGITLIYKWNLVSDWTEKNG
ncbi:hypothetical protein HMPREF1548_02568 [Clostridium sp. KLE 1755]|nr:hypothetical protein HMPREF1548_02568 [Clostridium sp. KLE 1755]